jgi:hypothetical protein
MMPPYHDPAARKLTGTIPGTLANSEIDWQR